MNWILSCLKQRAAEIGYTELSRRTGIPRTHFYSIFSDGGNPKLNSLLTITKALDLKLGLIMDFKQENGVQIAVT